MQYSNRWMIVIVLLIAAGLLSACAATSAGETTKIEPAHIEPIAGTEFNRVTLTEKAFQRLAIQTATISEMQVDETQRIVAPYAAVIYGLNGETWVYVSPEPLTYHREPITIDYIDGDMAVLVDGPSAGTEVVTVGVAELYGTDTGVGK